MGCIRAEQVKWPRGSAADRRGYVTRPRPHLPAPSAAPLATWALVSPDCAGAQMLGIRGGEAGCSARMTVSNSDNSMVLLRITPEELEIWTADQGWQRFQLRRPLATMPGLSR